MRRKEAIMFLLMNKPRKSLLSLLKWLGFLDNSANIRRILSIYEWKVLQNQYVVATVYMEAFTRLENYRNLLKNFDWNELLLLIQGDSRFKERFLKFCFKYRIKYFTVLPTSCFVGYAAVLSRIPIHWEAYTSSRINIMADIGYSVKIISERSKQDNLY